MNISAFHYFFESPNCLLIGGLFWLAMSARAQGLTLTAGRGGWGGGEHQSSSFEYLCPSGKVSWSSLIIILRTFCIGITECWLLILANS